MASNFVTTMKNSGCYSDECMSQTWKQIHEEAEINRRSRTLMESSAPTDQQMVDLVRSIWSGINISWLQFFNLVWICFLKDGLDQITTAKPVIFDPTNLDLLLHLYVYFKQKMQEC